MGRVLKNLCFCAAVMAVIWLGALVMDRQTLRRELVRLHVVAASDSQEDQAVKLRVRDAVLESLQAELQNLTDPEAAKAYLQENLPKIEAVANETLREAGFSDTARATLCLEEFDTRFYDTFSLPAGLYEALRIVIGPGEGQNWWCVVFPAFCMPDADQSFDDVACSAGFSQELTGTLEGEGPYQVRFFLLDAVGTLENILHRDG